MSETNVQNAVGAANNALQRSYSKRSTEPNKLGKDEFMKLLMAQVTHQDPLNPMDSEGMMNQLTNMGSYEQLVNLNKGVADMHETQRDLMRANTFSFLDKDVTIRGGGVPVAGGQAPGLQFAIPGDAESVAISIVDPSGQPVRQLKLGPQGPGSHAVAWDGRNAAGEPVPDGFYRYSVTATAADDQSLPVDLYVQGKVSGVNFKDGRPKLTVNGEEIDVRDVIEMSNRSEHLFSDQLPSALRQELRPGGPVTRRRH